MAREYHPPWVGLHRAGGQRGELPLVYRGRCRDHRTAEGSDPQARDQRAGEGGYHRAVDPLQPLEVEWGAHCEQPLYPG